MTVSNNNSLKMRQKVWELFNQERDANDQNEVQEIDKRILVGLQDFFNILEQEIEFYVCKAENYEEEIIREEVNKRGKVERKIEKVKKQLFHPNNIDLREKKEGYIKWMCSVFQSIKDMDIRDVNVIL